MYMSNYYFIQQACFLETRENEKERARVRDSETERKADRETEIAGRI